MKTKLFGLLIRLMYRNLSRGEYKCDSCRKTAEDIIEKIEKRERFVIPDFNASGCFMSYHIGNVSPREQMEYYMNKVLPILHKP